jgi:hypothetical protein
MTYSHKQMIREALADFAISNKLTVQEAMTLPALFERAANELELNQLKLARDAAYHNPTLGTYLADVARQVAAEAF